MRTGALCNILAILALTGVLLAPQSGKTYDGNYPDVDWLTLETEHFLIHYYPETEWSARMMAKYAEIAYPKVTGLFDYPLKEKVHIVIRDQEENANGWAAYSVDWVTVWATPLYYVLRGRQEWIPDCFTHEFGHIVSLKVNDWKAESAFVFFGSGLIEDGVNNIDFGARVMLGFATPFWWTEGIAEYSAHMAGFNWWTTARDMHLRMTVLDDNALSFEEMFTIGDKYSGFDGEKGYQQGYSMALYVQEKYGKENYAKLAVNSDKKGHLVWEKNIEDVLGVEGHELYDGYINWMRSRYDRQSAPIRKALHEGDRLTYTFGKEVREVEKLDNGKYKMELGVANYKFALPADVEEAEETIKKIDKTLEGEKVEKKEQLEAYKSVLKDAIKRYEAEGAKIDEDDKLAQMNKFAEVTASAIQAAGSLAMVDEALGELNKAASKPKVRYWDRRKRKAHFEAGSPWAMLPLISPDGKKVALASRAVKIMPIETKDLPVFSGRYLSGKRFGAMAEEGKIVKGASFWTGYDWNPDSKRMLFSSLRCPHTWLPCVQLDGYYRYDLFEYNMETEDVERLSYRLRAVYPSYSPDGKTIAFVHIEDGQNWLGLVPANARETTVDGKCVIDGKQKENCIKWLIKKHDGTQLGKPSFSPDGQRIITDLYRNHQQDIWMINADGSNLHPLTWDRAEDRDGAFTADGKGIIYASDRTGIFNAYHMDLGTREVKQLTNVLGGVFTPKLTPEGNMLFSYFNSFGLHFRGLKKEDFYNKVVDAGYEVTPEEVARNLAYEEELPEIRSKSTSYSPFNPKNWVPVQGIPLFLYERDAIGIGTQLIINDYLDKHTLIGQVLLGQTSDYRLIYVNDFWYPTFILGWVHIDFAGSLSQSIGSSAIVSTRSEEHFESPMNYKYRQSVDFGFAGISYELGHAITADLSYQYRYYTSQGRSDNQGDAFVTNNAYMASLEYNGISRRGTADVNPKGLRASLMYSLTRTGLPNQEFADVEWLGRHNPPGDNSDDYIYHEIQAAYQHNFPVSWWNRAGDHTLGLNIRAGWQNRNVQRWDEFSGGSLHPLRYVPTQSATQEFAGYEDFSLQGETMLIMSMAYRFPVYRRINRKFGPFYFAGVWAELAGTAGNLWGYTADYERDVYGNVANNPQSYWDPYVKRGTVRREVPFKDIASKNGNYLLYDVSFVLKLKGYMFGYLPWNSFVRVSYGLNDITAGMRDVNDDGIYVDNYPNDALIAETEPKSLRISIGIGSSFD